MKKIIILLLCAGPLLLKAQLFIDKAMVEYEVKTNIKKTLGNNMWAEKMKENLPQFKTSYFQLTFSDNKSVYKFHHWDDKVKIPDFLRRNDEENIWYFDHNAGTFNMQKNVFGSNFVVDDQINPIEWKLTNESRMIAGFNCRKAVGKIMDSVYVFVFYTEEILIPGGPCSLHGLPGLILGVTIPRLYASWIATTVQVNGVDASVIKPVSAKKTYTVKTLQTTLKDRTKDWADEADPDSKSWMDQLYWNTLL